MAQREVTRAAIWARVSTHEQHTANQLEELRAWAERRGLDVVAEFVTEDSGWQNGNGTKGKEFDKSRAALLDGARMGSYTVVLTWAIDRLSRRGIEDTLAALRRLGEAGCAVWSHQESWAEDLRDPRMRYKTVRARDDALAQVGQPLHLLEAAGAVDRFIDAQAAEVHGRNGGDRDEGDEPPAHPPVPEREPGFLSVGRPLLACLRALLWLDSSRRRTLIGGLILTSAGLVSHRSFAHCALTSRGSEAFGIRAGRPDKEPDGIRPPSQWRFLQHSTGELRATLAVQNG